MVCFFIPRVYRQTTTASDYDIITRLAKRFGKASEHLLGNTHGNAALQGMWQTRQQYEEELPILRGEDQEAIIKFFRPELIAFLVNEDIYHIESNGTALLVFRSLHEAKSQNIEQMVTFSGKLVDRLLQAPNLKL